MRKILVGAWVVVGLAYGGKVALGDVGSAGRLGPAGIGRTPCRRVARWAGSLQWTTTPSLPWEVKGRS